MPRVRSSWSRGPTSRSTRSPAGPAVGNATLYRHFPDRTGLFRHVVLFVMAHLSDQVETAIAEESDSFTALRRFVHAAAGEKIGALCPMLADGFDRADAEITAARDRLTDSVEDLMERARHEGQLRADVAVGDLFVALSQLTRPLPGTGCLDLDRFVHRHLQLFLDGLQAPARTVLPGSPATLEDLRRQS